MTVAIRMVDGKLANDIVEAMPLTPDNKTTMAQCLKSSPQIWVGLVGNDVACIWGVVPPSLMSNTAYLWLYATDKVKAHQFIFVRHSQRVMEELLGLYETITGVTDPSAESSKRWLKWLGAKFGDGLIGGYLPFVIRRK